jgi:hypothetical protein
MADIECQGVDPEDMIRELQESLQKSHENKYAFQVGLKDVDFDIDQEKCRALDINLPFRSIDQAEEALSQGIILPIELIEFDDTRHKVLVFDHRPVGYSGFMDCVTHSLALTDHGLFEVGRYPGVSLTEPAKQWQWFIHRRLATDEEMADLLQSRDQVPSELMESIYRALIGG